MHESRRTLSGRPPSKGCDSVSAWWGRCQSHRPLTPLPGLIGAHALTPHPDLLAIPGIETLSSFTSRRCPSVSSSLRFIPDKQPSISQPDDDDNAKNVVDWGNKEARLLWVRALRTSPVTWKAAAKLESCGSNPWVERCSVSSEYRVVAPACKLRFCPRCSGIHAGRTRRRLQTWAESVRRDDTFRLRLVTLTIRSTSAPLYHQLDFLYRSFRKLRQRALWKKATLGSIAVLQVTHNAQTNQWHPHLHVVQHGRFIDWHALKSAWLKITHGSDGVDIRPIRDVDKACEYVCRYVARPLDGEREMSPRNLVDYVMSTKGRRLLIASGNAPLIIPDEEPGTNEWLRVDSLAGLLQRARNHDPEALAILEQIHASAPVPPDDELTLFDLALDEDVDCNASTHPPDTPST